MDATVALAAGELREPNEFDLALLREEGAEYGRVRARGASIMTDAPRPARPSDPAPRFEEIRTGPVRSGSRPWALWLGAALALGTAVAWALTAV